MVQVGWFQGFGW